MNHEQILENRLLEEYKELEKLKSATLTVHHRINLIKNDMKKLKELKNETSTNLEK